MFCCIYLAVNGAAAQEKSEPSIQYIPLDPTIDAPPGTFTSAVMVDQMPLVHTRQLFPFDPDGVLIGENSPDKQIEQLLDNLETVLKQSGSELNKLVRVNVYALSKTLVASFQQQLGNRLSSSIRPAITAVLTPLPHRGVEIALDAVAGAADGGTNVTLQRCTEIAGSDQCADVAVLPPGGIAYLSGHPEGFELTQLPATKSMTRLMKTLEQLQLAPEHGIVEKGIISYKENSAKIGAATPINCRQVHEESRIADEKAGR